MYNYMWGDRCAIGPMRSIEALYLHSVHAKSINRLLYLSYEKLAVVCYAVLEKGGGGEREREEGESERGKERNALKQIDIM